MRKCVVRGSEQRGDVLAPPATRALDLFPVVIEGGIVKVDTARRLGANVTATDVRPEVKEQIESVGAKYVGIELKQDASAGGQPARPVGDSRHADAALVRGGFAEAQRNV